MDYQYWEFNEELKKSAPKKKAYQKDQMLDTSWLPSRLNKKGFKVLQEKLRIVENKKEFDIVYSNALMRNYIDCFENIFSKLKKSS